ncbi:UNVERIFIED_CONTAM: Heterogeneous nuclear ribonucleoprotein 1 [Sesamum radiatum]|uniref:Heterogeneous nuclear ribonucleoprotein 1 n=1 Tax=Sesamum radiatum TaxID=300843 RepID=A0AAW2K2R7_SESRA
MEMEAGKLFIGGISWDTSEERLREYFQAFGEIVEAVIMRDRTTGRARGFGFIVFANASVAEKVVRERHIIDGRTMGYKISNESRNRQRRAINQVMLVTLICLNGGGKEGCPRDDHQNFNRNNGSIQGSPCLARTKKIFVGGLASTVTESDFKRYFEQFGTITDVVVMYDHNTQRPRGFGFITYDSEEAVDKVLVKTFHELNGKMVEVKRAVPKELSPGPTRSPSSGYNYGLNRASSFLNPYTQGYNANSAGGYGMRMDGRFSPVTVGRSGYAPYSPSNHSIGSSFDSGFSLNLGASADSGLGYGHGMNSYFSGNPSRYGSPIAYGNAGIVGGIGTIGEIWGFSPVSAKGREGSSLSSGNILYGHGDNIGGRAGYVRNNGGTAGTPLSYSVTNNVRNGGLGNLYGDDSFYLDHTWHSSSPELDDPVSFDYGHGSAAADVTSNNSVGYPGTYSTISARSNRGIAA